MYLSDEEYNQILGHAGRAGLSLSTYAKRVCIGMPVESRVDAQATLRLLKASADMGRLGGLLKLWLTTPDRLEKEARHFLHALEETRKRLDAKITEL